MSAVPSAPDIIRTIADELPVAVWVARAPSGEFVYANRRFEEIMGTGGRADVAVGEYAAPYGICDRSGRLYPEDQMPFVRALAARATVVVDDIVIHRPDGHRAYVRAFARPIFGGPGDASHDITHVIIAFIEITREVEAEAARQESEARLSRAQRLESVGTLAGGVAHDFNNLLMVLKLVAAQLARGEGDPQRARSLAIIDEITDRAAALTRSLMAFARRDEHRPRRLSLGHVVESLAEIIRRALGEGISVALEVEPGCDIVGDFSQLEQVVMNLVVNARDAMAGMDQPGALQVRTRRVELAPATAARLEPLSPGPAACLEVIDTGRGIPPAIRDRIFEPYFTTRDQGPEKGTGLGLATVYGIVQSHGGAIEVDAGPDGRGTAMRVYLPLAHSGEQRAGLAQPAARLLRGSCTVLVVDDDDLVRRAISASLRELGYTVIEAADGEQALAAFQERRAEIAAVLLDVVMPRMSGRACFEALVAIEPDISIVLMSGHGDQAESILDLGARAFLAKPCSVEQLSTALAAAVAR